MKRMNRAILWLAPLVALASMIGCEFESADGFNTSQGGGGAVSFSGVYTEYRPERAAVSGTDITRLIITQTGNTIEVLDNHNAYYQGTVGSPGVVGAPNPDGTYPPGAAMMAAQVNFSGGDVQFVGVVRAIAITDIESEEVTVAVTKEDTESTADTDDETETSGTSSDTTTTSTTTSQAGNTTITSTTTTTESESEDETDGEVTENTETESRTRSDANTKQYSIDESNTHYVLEGNWVQGGTVHELRAMSHAANPAVFGASDVTDTGF